MPKFQENQRCEGLRLMELKNPPKKRKLKACIAIIKWFSKMENKQQALSIFREIFIKQIYKNDKPAKLIYDLGSHKGLASIYLGLKNPGAIVCSFEANQKTFMQLLDIIWQLPFIKPYSMAAGDGQKHDFYNLSNDATSTGAGFFPKKNKETRPRYEMNTYTLKELFELTGVPDFIKMDIEGSEIVVLPQLKGLKEKPKEIIMEIHRQVNRWDVHKWLQDAGYNFSSRYILGNLIYHAWR